MESVDRQLQQQKENYEHMNDGELCALAEEAYDLIDIAREALQAVITEKGYDVRLKVERPAVERPEDDLVIFGWAKSAKEAELTIKTLAAAGIPSFLNLEVRSGDLQRAHAAMLRAIDEELEAADPEEKDYAILCPRCRSAKVVLKGRDTDLAAPLPRPSSSGAAMPAAISGWTMASRRKLPAGSPGREKSFPVTRTLLKSGTRDG